jgi:hypothetical protein
LLVVVAIPSASFAKKNKDASLAGIESRLSKLEREFYAHDNEIEQREPGNAEMGRRLLALEKDVAECCDRAKNKAK